MVVALVLFVVVSFIGSFFVKEFVMSTGSKKKSSNTLSAAEKWRQGTDHYQAAFKPTADKIHERAKQMSAEGADPADIVAMAAEESSKFAQDYHSDKE